MAIYKEDFIDIELNNGTISRSFMNRTIGEGDAQANRFGIHVFRNGEPEQLSGVTCEGYFIRSTGDTVPISGTASGNAAWVDLPVACYAYEGQFALAIKLTGGNVTGTMRIVDGVVVNTTTGAVVDPGTVIPSIETLIAAINDAVESIPPEYEGLVDAFISRGLAFDLFSMYGNTTNDTSATVTYAWNGQTCTVSGTATGSMSLNNFINIPLPSKGLKAPVKCAVKLEGNYQKVYVQLFELKNGSVVESKYISTSENIKFADGTADQFIARLAVNQGNTASGSISIKIYNEDMTPFGMHVFETPNDGDDIDNIGNGIFMLSDSGTYVHEPPFIPCYLLSYELYNTGLQMAFPYTGGNRNTVNPVMRSKHIDGTWTDWYTQSEFTQDISKYASNGSVDIDNVTEPGFYLLHDGYTYTNLAFQGIGFLLVYRSINVRLQIAIPWSTKAIYIRRNLNDAAWSGWETAGGGGNVYNITNEYSFPEYSQSVTLNAYPTITTDTNNYLASTGDTTDRTSNILAMLTATGICRLGPGVFYVNNLQMPDGSAIIGSGYSTVIRLAGTSDGYAIKIGSRCTVKDARIRGAETDLTFSSTIGGRHGILWQGDYTEHSTAPDRSMISNVWIHNFTGGGITCYDTGYGTNNGLEVTNVYTFACWAGINISYWSEFHKFTNVRSGNCYIGCVNNGGNNVFVNCDFSSNQEIAMLMDNSQGQSPNNSHGSCIGCVFNHTAHAGTSNAGTGIKILNCGSGFMFTGCQIFFSQIYLEDTDGIVIADTNFGNSNCDVTIVNGGAVVFANCMVEGSIPVSITNNSKVHFTNCYNKSSGTAWPS